MKNDPAIFDQGNIVKWSSQAQGSEKEKKGKIIAVVYPGQRASKCLPEGTDIRNKTHVKFDTDVAIYQRYIVAVPRGGKNTKIDYYCPRVSALQVVPKQ